MRIGVLVRWVLDATLPLAVDEAARRVRAQEDASLWILEPADRIALSLALRLKREIAGTSVLAWTIGPVEALAAARHALAAGADGAGHLLAPAGVGDPASADGAGPEAPLAARALAVVLANEGVDLFLCGGRTLVEGASPVAALVAAHLGWPVLTELAELRVEQHGGPGGAPRLLAERRLDRGWREQVEVALPAAAAVEPGLAEPRYVSRLALERASGRAVARLPLSDVLAGVPSGLPEPPAIAAVTPPRPRPRRSATLAAAASGAAADRLRALMGRAGKPAAASALVEGPAAQLAERFCRFLAERDLLTPSRQRCP